MQELETLIVQANDTNDKLDELITVNESSLVQQKEIAESISELNPTMEAILVKLAEEKDQEKVTVSKMDSLPKELNSVVGGFSTVFIKGEKGDSPSEEELNKLIKPLLPTNEDLEKLIEPLIPEPIKGDDGEDYILTNEDKEEIASMIEVPIVEKVIEKTIIEQPIDKTVTIDKTKTIIKEVAKYETGEEIVQKINKLPKSIDWKTIKNAPEIKNNGGNGIGYINEASDVSVSNLQNNQTLKWNSQKNAWENGTLSGGGDVQSVNDVEPNETGNIELDTDDIPEGTTNKYYSDTLVGTYLATLTEPNRILYTNDENEIITDALFFREESGTTAIAKQFTEDSLGGFILGDADVEGDIISEYVGEYYAYEPYGMEVWAGVGQFLDIGFGFANHLIKAKSTNFGWETNVATYPDAFITDSTVGLYNSKIESIGSVVQETITDFNTGYINKTGVNEIGMFYNVSDDVLTESQYYFARGATDEGKVQVMDSSGTQLIWDYPIIFGNPTSGGDPFSILYLDDLGNLTQDSLFYRDDTQETYIGNEWQVGNEGTLVNSTGFIFGGLFPFAGSSVSDGVNSSQFGVADASDVDPNFKNILFAFTENADGDGVLFGSGTEMAFGSTNGGDEGIDLVEYQLYWSGFNGRAGFYGYSDTDAYSRFIGLDLGIPKYIDDITEEEYWLPTNFPTSNYDEIEVVDYTTGETQWSKKSDTYTPTLTGVSNVTSSTAYEVNYHRVGDTVTVTGELEVESTTNNAETKIRISLPVPSDFTTVRQLTGLCHSTDTTVAGHGGVVLADTTNNEAVLSFYETHTTSETIVFSFTYKIV